MNNGFEQDIIEHARWTNTLGEVLRLVNMGAGPDVLQILRDGKFIDESNHFKWSGLCAEFVRLKQDKAELWEMLVECESKWGCECPYCDRNFGDDFESHHDDCKIGKLLAEHKEG